MANEIQNKYIVIEIQTDTNGRVATLVTAYDTDLEAESAFHSILAAAALSSLPKHAAVILTSDGGYGDAKTYYHGDD